MKSFYHEIFKMDRQNPVQVYTHKGKTNYIVSEHWHRSLEIDFIYDSSVFFWINGMKVHVQPQTIILVNSGDIHALEPAEGCFLEEEKLYGASLFISYDFLKEACPEIDHIFFRLEGNKEKLKELKSVCNQLIELYLSKEEEYSYLKLNSIVYRICYLLCTYFRQEKNCIMIKSQKYIERLRKIIDYMEENFQNPLTLQGLAEHYNISMEYLAKIFKTYTGSTFKDLLNKIRLNHAYVDIMDTDYSMLEIAMKNGFSDARSFNHIFRRVYGMTPFQYKKEYSRQRSLEKGEHWEDHPHIQVIEK